VHLLALSPGGVLARTRQLAPAGLGRPTDRFGASLAALEGAGAAGGPALAVGAPGARSSDERSLLDVGSEVDGTVHVVDVGGAEAGAGGGTLLATLASPEPLRGALFGYALAGAPDYDGNGVADLVVGAPASAGGGALFVLFLGRNASQGGALHAVGHRRVGAADLDLAQDAGLGRSLARLGRVDADLVEDLSAGVYYDAPDHENGGQLIESAGGALVLLLNAHTYPHPPPAPPPSAPLPPAPPLDSWEVRVRARVRARVRVKARVRVRVRVKVRVRVRVRVSSTAGGCACSTSTTAQYLPWVSPRSRLHLPRCACWTSTTAGARRTARPPSCGTPRSPRARWRAPHSPSPKPKPEPEPEPEPEP
jgi:hypothetical protein